MKTVEEEEEGVQTPSTFPKRMSNLKKGQDKTVGLCLDLFFSLFGIVGILR